MKTKRVVKILTFFIIVTVLGLLIKNNVSIAITEENNNSSVLALNLNSDIIQHLYKSLNLDLINNNCKKKCLMNSTYNFMYFDFEDNKKILSDAERLYLVFNSLNEKKLLLSYKEDEYTKLIVDGEIVKEEMNNLFESSEFDKNFMRSSDCGIIDYLYTGKSYEFIIKACDKDNKTIGYSKLVSAKKEGNDIKLKIASFKANFEEKEKYILTAFNSDKEIAKVSYKDLTSNINKLFKKYDFEKFIFSFELRGENYYLREIEKDDN